MRGAWGSANAGGAAGRRYCRCLPSPAQAGSRRAKRFAVGAKRPQSIRCQKRLPRADVLCLHAQGEDAEALRVYDLCRRMLAAAVGARPSAATGAIRCIIAAAAGDVSAGGSVDA